MKIEIIKAKEVKSKYEAGDVISLGNPYQVKHYLLIDREQFNKILVGAVDLTSGELSYYYEHSEGFNFVVEHILKDNDWDEWTLIKSEDVTMTLNCKNGAEQQRNNSGSF